MPDEPKTETTAGTGDPEPPPHADAPAPGEAPVDAPAEAAPAEAAEAPEDAPGPADGASPAQILKRVSALDEDDETERMARAEEAKLEARRKQERKPKKKSALESAASKKLQKIGEKAPSKRAVAVATDAEPLVDRAVDLGEWARKNQRVVTGVVAAAVVAIAGSVGYVAYQHKREGDASIQLAKAITDEHGIIGDPDKEEDPDRPHDPTPIFKTNDERRDTALADYRAVETKYPGTGAAILARLSEGSLLLDKDDAPGALAAYSDVSKSALAKADAEVRGRSLEGMGFAYEEEATAAGDAEKGKDALEKAGQQFRALENTDVVGFKELGMYHEARVLAKQGTTDKAIEMLKTLHERLAKTESSPFVYLQPVADDALRSLSPESLPRKPSAPPGLGGARGGLGLGKGGSHNIDPEQLKKLYEQLQKSGAGGKGPTPPAGAPP